jgi:hypothetical protein
LTLDCRQNNLTMTACRAVASPPKEALMSSEADGDLAEAAMVAASILDPLDQIHALAELGDVTDQWMVRAVRAARAEDRSWTEIGDSLGVTKQSAFSKYRALVDEDREGSRQ